MRAGGTSRSPRCRRSSPCAPHASATKQRAGTSGATCDRRGCAGPGGDRPLPEPARDPAAGGADVHEVRRRLRRQRRDRARAPRRARRDRLARRTRRARRLRPCVARGRGRRRAVPRHRFLLAHAAHVLRGMAARPIPDHLLPEADRAGLAALARRFRCGRGGGCAAPLRDRNRPRQSPSRETTFEALRRHRGTTIFDLDWRPTLWDDPGAYPALAAQAVASADIVIGNEEEVEAAGVDVPTLVLKRGEHGATVFEQGEETDVPGFPVEVVNGLGAGDAFAAALGQSLLAGLKLVEAVRRGTVAGALVAAQLACSEAMPRLEQLEAALV